MEYFPGDSQGELTTSGPIESLIYDDGLQGDLNWERKKVR